MANCLYREERQPDRGREEREEGGSERQRECERQTDRERESERQRERHRRREC